MLAEDLALVVLGTGEKKYHQWLSDIAERHPAKVAVHLGFDNELAHKIEAGADMFLMPSRYEPCGLNQIYSLRYGTVPIVRATGGLYDSVRPFDQERGDGVGFCFHEYKAEAFWRAVQTALTCFEQPKVWQQIVKNGMAMDFSWTTSARQYLALYQEVMSEGGTQEKG